MQPTFNIYVPSYHRWDTTQVYKNLEYCTYVVRKSEEQFYKDLGVDTWAVEDENINSFAKVQNYIIKNAKEDVVCVLDDDIDNFYYRLEKSDRIKDIEVITRELERLGQLCYDLDIGLLGSPIRNIPWGYTAEFHFSGMIGPIRYYNRKKIKSKYIQMSFFGDTDFVLQELLNNRIILRPDYFVTDAKLETNKGGMNTKRNKAIQLSNYEKMQEKWGKYINFNSKKNVTQIRVKR